LFNRAGSGDEVSKTFLLRVSRPACAMLHGLAAPADVGPSYVNSTLVEPRPRYRPEKVLLHVHSVSSVPSSSVGLLPSAGFARRRMMFAGLACPLANRKLRTLGIFCSDWAKCETGGVRRIGPLAASKRYQAGARDRRRKERAAENDSPPLVGTIWVDGRTLGQSVPGRNGPVLECADSGRTSLRHHRRKSPGASAKSSMESRAFDSSAGLSLVDIDDLGFRELEMASGKAQDLAVAVRLCGRAG